MVAAPVSLAPPNFSSVMTRSLSSSGRLCVKKGLFNKPQQEERDWLGPDDATYLQEPLQVDVILLLSLDRRNRHTHTQKVTSESTWKRGDSQRGGSYLLAAFLEHVLLFLRHQLPLFAAQHHALRAGDVLHVDHQLGAVQRVAVAAQTHATVSRQLSVASCKCAATLATVGSTHGGGLVGRPSNLSFSCRSALVRTERTWSSELASG